MVDIIRTARIEAPAPTVDPATIRAIKAAAGQLEELSTSLAETMETLLPAPGRVLRDGALGFGRTLTIGLGRGGRLLLCPSASRSRPR
jgi:hypothetical protein